jgi:DNA-binding transcriptional ArsR family regulator
VAVAEPGEDEIVELVEATAIRAIAHPARLLVIEALYDHDRKLTATQAAALAGITPSAMSYHLRALERAGLVRRGVSTDGRERPWVRAGKDIRISMRSPGANRATALATGAVLSSSIDTTRRRLLRALERSATPSKDKGPLDEVIHFSQSSLVVTEAEARELLEQFIELLKPWRIDERSERPAESGLLNVLIMAASEDEVGIEREEPRS